MHEYRNTESVTHDCLSFFNVKRDNDIERMRCYTGYHAIL